MRDSFLCLSFLCFLLSCGGLQPVSMAAQLPHGMPACRQTVLCLRCCFLSSCFLAFSSSASSLNCFSSSFLLPKVRPDSIVFWRGGGCDSSSAHYSSGCIALRGASSCGETRWRDQRNAFMNAQPAVLAPHDSWQPPTVRMSEQQIKTSFGFQQLWRSPGCSSSFNICWNTAAHHSIKADGS